jgi:sulfopyruvate decarboxylase subunit beta
MMKRDDCFRAIARHIGDAIVLPVYSSAFDWLEIAPRPLNYFAFGAMGLGSSVALGLALGRPDKRVVALDGDGSHLMNLAALVTIGAAAPKNLVHFVARNATYEANGGHPIPNQAVDFAGMARAAGYAHCHEFSELASFEQQVGHVLTQDGPVMAVLHVEKGALAPEFNYRKLADPKLREAFRDALRAS